MMLYGGGGGGGGSYELWGIFCEFKSFICIFISILPYVLSCDIWPYHNGALLYIGNVEDYLCRYYIIASNNHNNQLDIQHNNDVIVTLKRHRSVVLMW